MWRVWDLCGHLSNAGTTTHLCQDSGEHLWVVWERENHWRQLVCMGATWTVMQEVGGVNQWISGEHEGPMDIWQHGGHLWMSGVCGPPTSIECMRRRECMRRQECMRTSSGCLGCLGVCGLLGHMRTTFGCWVCVGTIWTPRVLGTFCEVWETWGPSVHIRDVWRPSEMSEVHRTV